MGRGGGGGGVENSRKLLQNGAIFLVKRERVEVLSAYVSLILFSNEVEDAYAQFLEFPRMSYTTFIFVIKSSSFMIYLLGLESVSKQRPMQMQSGSTPELCQF